MLAQRVHGMEARRQSRDSVIAPCLMINVNWLISVGLSSKSVFRFASTASFSSFAMVAAIPRPMRIVVVSIFSFILRRNSDHARLQANGDNTHLSRQPFSRTRISGALGRRHSRRISRNRRGVIVSERRLWRLLVASVLGRGRSGTRRSGPVSM